MSNKTSALPMHNLACGLLKEVATTASTWRRLGTAGLLHSSPACRHGCVDNYFGGTIRIYDAGESCPDCQVVSARGISWSQRRNRQRIGMRIRPN